MCLSIKHSILKISRYVEVSSSDLLLSTLSPLSNASRTIVLLHFNRIKKDVPIRVRMYATVYGGIRPNFFCKTGMWLNDGVERVERRC